MKSKSILIFGAGINQLTLIQAARELGFNAIAIDPLGDPPGSKVADHFYQVSGQDYALTKEIAIKHNVSGIVTGQMENPLRIMARLAKDMGLIFHSPEVVERSTNKYLMKQAFQASGVPCAKGILVKHGKFLPPDMLVGFPYPFIIKPPTAFSSRGVYRISSYEEYRERLLTTVTFSPDDSYLIEEFVDGVEFSVETITHKGKTSVIQHTEKMITPFPETVEIGHIQPGVLTNQQRCLTDTTVIKAIKALGIDNSAAHTELKLTAKGPVIIEIGPRLGGDFISSHLTRISTGCNMEAAAVNVAVGIPPDLKIHHDTGSAIVYLSLPTGSVVKTISDSSTVTQDEYYVMHNLSIKPGDCIADITDSSKRPGFVIARGETGQLAYNNALELAKRLTQTIIVANKV